MAKIESAFFDLSYLDALAAGDSLVHRLDPRIKIIITMVFVVCVVSYDKYAITAMLPFFLFPVFMMTAGGIPFSFLLKKLILVSPFAIMVGIFNPFFDQETMLFLGSVAVSGGWVSFLSILLRFTLTVSGVLLLIATTGFNAVCMAMERLGMPRVFAVQLLLLYRYIFVLVDEGMRIYRARALRSFKGRGMGMTVFTHLLGQLLLRTLDRAQRIHLAMLCRGFDGIIRVRRTLTITGHDLVFLFGACAAFLAMRCFDFPLLLGQAITEFWL
jgi:cobalt/nickel transport system permease protein